MISGSLLEQGCILTVATRNRQYKFLLNFIVCAGFLFCWKYKLHDVMVKEIWSVITILIYTNYVTCNEWPGCQVCASKSG